MKSKRIKRRDNMKVLIESIGKMGKVMKKSQKILIL